MLAPPPLQRLAPNVHLYNHLFQEVLSDEAEPPPTHPDTLLGTTPRSDHRAKPEGQGLVSCTSVGQGCFPSLAEKGSFQSCLFQGPHGWLRVFHRLHSAPWPSPRLTNFPWGLLGSEAFKHVERRLNPGLAVTCTNTHMHTSVPRKSSSFKRALRAAG